MKKNFKWVSLMLALVMMFVIVTGCTPKAPASTDSSSAEQQSSAPEKVYVIKASGSQAATEPPILAMEEFKKNVETKSNGRIKVEVYPNNQLGNERDVIEGLQLGTVEMVWPSNAPLTAFVPTLNLFELPYLFENRQHLYAVLDSDIGQSFQKDLNSKGFQLLGYFEVGVRHIMTTTKAIQDIKDIKGLKIRTMENPAHLDAFKAFGANPLPMAYGELYTALESKVIDGAEAANTNYLAKKFYEVAPNWAMVGWMHLVSPLIMSKSFYDSLPADLQQIINEEAANTVKLERKLYAETDEKAYDELIKAGVNVTKPDRAPFVEAAQVVYDNWASKVGGRDKIDAILNFKY